jgi:hypothetical protein
MSRERYRSPTLAYVFAALRENTLLSIQLTLVVSRDKRQTSLV